jgi:type I restriction enzyme M protein
MSGEQQIRNHASLIWSVADKLRGVYKQSEYGRVILPLVVLRRLDCVLEPTKADVLARATKLKGRVENVAPVLESVAGEQFYNTSPLDFRRLLDDPANVAGNLRSYIAGFSPSAREVIEKFGFDAQIVRLERANLLYLVVSQFADVDLHPSAVSNLEMGYLYEELVRRFSELSNETAGEHFTPREVIRLMVNLLFVEDEDVLTKRGIVKTLFDPACGTGGMLSLAEDYLRELNPAARLEVFGQELNEETYAICRSDMVLKGQDASHIVQGNSFDDDGHRGRTFDYMLANPPFGVEWKSVAGFVKDERERLGFRGRFGAGLPAINDGSFLFLQHMISKMKLAEEGGSRLAIVFNGSPLFTGAAGSGPSEIRRWIIESDWLEAVVALPDQLFYNTGISTYFWVVTNRKSAERRGKVQLVDARDLWVKMRKSLGEKRKAVSPEQIEEITRLYGAFEENERVKIVRNDQFGYQRITVERPLRLRYSGDGARDRLETSKEFAKLEGEQRERLVDLVVALADFVTTDRAEAASAVAAANGRLSKAEEKALLNALAVRDPEAPASDKPDPELRDQGNVALPAESVRFEPDPSSRLASEPYTRVLSEYLTTDVLPYVPDAWVDVGKTKIGYEIPVTRHFYAYRQPRAVDEIDGEMRELEEQIQELLTLAASRSTLLASALLGGDAAGERVSSSVGWLPERPSHWRDARLTLLARLGSGHTPSRDRPEWWENCTIPWITTGDISVMRGDRDEFIHDTKHHISEEGLLNSAAELHPEGTVVLSRTASVGFSAIMARPMATSQDFATWTCGDLLRPRFLLLCLRVMRPDLLGRLAMGSTHKTIYMPEIEAIRIPLPPVEEQEEIVEAVWESLRPLDAAAEALTHRIALLGEKRAALSLALVGGNLRAVAAG